MPKRTHRVEKARLSEDGQIFSGDGGQASAAQISRPFGVTVDAFGNIFIADGYNNSRVVKVDKNGRWVKTWGDRGADTGQFNILHSIANDAKGNIYVGDRGNARVQVLDNDLNWKANYPNVGNPWAVCVSGGPGPKNPGKQYLYVSNSWQDSAPAAGAEFTGEVYKMELDGTIVGKFGRRGRNAGQWHWMHTLAADSQGNLYTGEGNNAKRGQRFVFRGVVPSAPN